VSEGGVIEGFGGLSIASELVRGGESVAASIILKQASGELSRES